MLCPIIHKTVKRVVVKAYTELNDSFSLYSPRMQEINSGACLCVSFEYYRAASRITLETSTCSLGCNSTLAKEANCETAAL